MARGSYAGRKEKIKNEILENDKGRRNNGKRFIYVQQTILYEMIETKILTPFDTQVNHA